MLLAGNPAPVVEVGILSIFFKVLYIQSVVQDFFQQYDWYVDLIYKWHNMTNLEVQFKLQWFDQELPAKFCAVECCSQIHMFFLLLAWLDSMIEDHWKGMAFL